MKNIGIKRIFAAMLTVAILFCTTGVVFAYFSKTINGGTRGISSASTDINVEVSDCRGLFLASKAPELNDGEHVSTERKTIKFTTDITLESDLVITADCHINLGGNKLIMNGHSLTVKHMYSGGFTVWNGTVVTAGTNEKIFIDTPNAQFIPHPTTGTLDFTDADGVTVGSCIVLVTENIKYIAYEALYMVAGAIINETDEGMARLDITAVGEETARITGTAETSYVFSPSVYLKTNNSFVFGDIDLPFTYGNYSNIEITYVSSNTGALSVRGNVTPATATQAVTLTAIVKIDNAEKARCEFSLSIVGTDAAARALAGETLILDYLSKYYQNITASGDTPAFTGYAFNREVYLPIKLNCLPEITFSYSAMASVNPIPADNFVTVPTGTATDNIIKFEPVDTLTSFTVTLYNASNVQVGGFTTNAMSGSSGIIVTDSSIASDIVNDWYGGTIEISSVVDAGQVVSFSRQALHTTTGAWGLTATERNLGVISVENELMNNTNDVYEITTEADESGAHSEVLAVKAGKNPDDYVQTVLLNVKLTFTGDKVVEIQVPINYIQGGSISTNANSFLPYYTFYNELLYSKITAYTINSFTMPFCYGNGSPIICYDIEGDTSGAISLALYYGGEIKTTLTLGGAVTSYTTALDNYITAAGITLSTIINSGDARWEFLIDKDKILTENKEINLIYNYKADKNSSWVRYRNLETDEPIVSTFILAGILRCYNSAGAQTAAETVKDENLYKWMYDNFNPTFGTETADTYTVGNATDRITKYVYVDWLLQNVALDRTSNATLAAVTDWAGLQFLKGTKYVNLSGFDMSENIDVDGTSVEAPKVIAEYLSEMISITELNLSDTNFYDRASAAVDDNGTVAFLTMLPALETLYVDTNDIFSFEWLLDIPSLNSVYVYGNFTLYVNGIFYGSKGLTNLSYFQELTDNGVKVFNDVADNNPILFEEGDSARDYMNLRGIEYQNILPVGADISLVYSDFSTTRSDYDLASTYTQNGTTYTVANTSTLVWGYIGNSPTTATTFTLTYTINWTGGQNTIVLVLKFNITRK